MKGCEEAFGGGRRGESTVRLRSDGGCEIIPDRPAKVSLLLFSPSFLVSPPSSEAVQKATGTSSLPPFHSQTRLREKMSEVQHRIKRREGPLQPTHTCWASSPNLSESISSPPPVQSNHITLVSHQRVSLHHSSPPHIPHHFSFILLSTFVFLSYASSSSLSMESADSKKKRKWAWAKCLGTFKCGRRAAQHIHLTKCSTVKCSMYGEPSSISLLCQLIFCGRYQRCL